MKREEAIAVTKELLDCCMGLDGCSIELTPSVLPAGGYQIIIKGVLDEKTTQQLNAIAEAHQFAVQVGNIWKTKHSLNKTEPDTHVIYRSKK